MQLEIKKLIASLLLKINFQADYKFQVVLILFLLVCYHLCF